MIKHELQKADLAHRIVHGLLIAASGLLAPFLPSKSSATTMTEDDVYDPELAAQFGAYLIYQAGGRLPKITLSKFMYIGERECVRTSWTPLFNDRHFAVKQGPICTRVVDGLSFKRDRKIFSKLMRRDGDDLVLADRLTQRDFSALSPAILDIADRVWQRYGHLSPEEIVDETHGPDFPEWQAGDNRIEITDERLAEVLGIDPAKYATSKRDFEALRRLGRRHVR